MNKVKFHTVEQPNSDTTTFVLSCNRLDVLDKTIKSFLSTRDYITKMVIVDDSAEPGVFETLVSRYGGFSDVICFPNNRSQWWAMDFMVSYCDSEYIFYLEDDWELLQPNYLNLSKQILKKYRNIGLVDISWRTFEWQGIDSYDKTLIDGCFYHKKPWKITDYHYHWYGWCGSPNLKRRDDLILLGRVEKWHNEWNIDRRFLSLGLKSVYLNGEYARHLGDNCSKMEGKRPDDSKTPDDYYPEELKKDRILPKLDYLFLDKHWKHPYDITLVSMLVDIGRDDRDFEKHYFDNLSNLLSSRHPIHIYCDEKYFDKIKKIKNASGGAPLDLFKYDKSDLEKEWFFKPITDITSKESWYNQAEWLKISVNRNPYYIPLTMLKHKFMKQTMDQSGASYFYWIDSGIFSSYGINENINNFYFTRIPKDNFFMTSYDYNTNTEIHGFNIDGMTRICGSKPNYVCRATLFGGSKYQIDIMKELFYSELKDCIDQGYIGTEESIYTILSKKFPQAINRFAMENGNIYNYLKTIKG